MMRSLEVVGLGAGGHAKLVIDAIDSAGVYEVIGLLDPDESLWETRVAGKLVLGGDELLGKIRLDGVDRAFLGVGSTGDTTRRRMVFEKACSEGFEIATVRHTASYVSATSTLGEGTVILANATVGPESRVGRNVSINAGAVVEHDTVVEDHAQIATGALLCGGVHIGPGAHIGAGASVKQGVRIGDGATVGAGAAVIRDVEAGSVVVGVPARRIR